MGYSFRLASRVLLYASTDRQDSTYHRLSYTSRGALAGTRNSSKGPPWGIDPTTHRTMSERSDHGATSRSYLMLQWLLVYLYAHVVTQLCTIYDAPCVSHNAFLFQCFFLDRFWGVGGGGATIVQLFKQFYVCHLYEWVTLAQKNPEYKITLRKEWNVFNDVFGTFYVCHL